MKKQTWEYPDTQIKDIEKLPNPRLHQIISFVKSGIRIISCFIGIIGFYELGFFVLIVAEIVGIAEELV